MVNSISAMTGNKYMAGQIQYVVAFFVAPTIHSRGTPLLVFMETD